MFKTKIIQTSLHQVHFRQHCLNLQILLSNLINQYAVLTLLVFTAIKQRSYLLLFFLYYLLQTLICFLKFNFLILGIVQLRLKSFDLSSQLSNLFCFKDLLLVGDVFFELVKFFKTNVHFIFVLFGKVLSYLFQLIFKTRILWFSNWWRNLNGFQRRLDFLIGFSSNINFLNFRLSLCFFLFFFR